MEKRVVNPNPVIENLIEAQEHPKPKNTWWIISVVVLALIVVTVGVMAVMFKGEDERSHLLHICQDVTLQQTGDANPMNGTAKWKSSIELMGYKQGDELTLDFCVEVRDFRTGPEDKGPIDTRLWVELPIGLEYVEGSFRLWQTDPSNGSSEFTLDPEALDVHDMFKPKGLRVPPICYDGFAVIVVYSARVNWDALAANEEEIYVLTRATSGQCQGSVSTPVFIRTI